MKYTFIILSIAAFVLSVSNPIALKAKIGKFVSCDMGYAYQEDAQADYDNYLSNPTGNERFKNLDRDKDGVACEDLPNKK